jgi:hypothetical protein
MKFLAGTSRKEGRSSRWMPPLLAVCVLNDRYGSRLARWHNHELPRHRSASAWESMDLSTSILGFVVSCSVLAMVCVAGVFVVNFLSERIWVHSQLFHGYPSKKSAASRNVTNSRGRNQRLPVGRNNFQAAETLRYSQSLQNVHPTQRALGRNEDVS